jgi:hypothetical protein
MKYKHAIINHVMWFTLCERNMNKVTFLNILLTCSESLGMCLYTFSEHNGSYN